MQVCNGVGSKCVLCGMLINVSDYMDEDVCGTGYFSLPGMMFLKLNADV